MKKSLFVMTAVLSGGLSVFGQDAVPGRAVQDQPASAAKAGPASYYPDPGLTPGAVLPETTVQQICTPGYSKSVRNVSEQTKKAVFERYHVAYVPDAYEVDHFISLELGGSNAVENLWPEPYEPKPGARQKDVVENELHRQICKGQMTLAQAQSIISGDWYAFYVNLPKMKEKRLSGSASAKEAKAMLGRPEQPVSAVPAEPVVGPAAAPAASPAVVPASAGSEFVGAAP